MAPVDPSSFHYGRTGEGLASLISSCEYDVIGKMAGTVSECEWAATLHIVQPTTHSMLCVYNGRPPLAMPGNLSLASFLGTRLFSALLWSHTLMWESFYHFMNLPVMCPTTPRTGRGKQTAPIVGNLITSVLRILHSCTLRCIKAWEFCPRSYKTLNCL